MLSLAVTHFERPDLLREAITRVEGDFRLEEILIVDDCSQDGSWDELVASYWALPRFKLHRNERNLDCYANKRRAVELATQPWVLLFDSDNVLGPEYLDALGTVLGWAMDPQTAYLPTFAMPEFDYREFAGLRVTRETVAGLMDRPMFATALNTANYVVNRRSYLEVWDPAVDPRTADSIYMNWRWLESGRALRFVEGMEYFHRIHPGSHFMTKHNAASERFKADVEDRLRRMR